MTRLCVPVPCYMLTRIVDICFVMANRNLLVALFLLLATLLAAKAVVIDLNVDNFDQVSEERS